MITSKSPLYAKVYDILLKRIKNGIYPVGSTLLPEPELCAEFNTSRTTIRKAVEMLARENYVEIQQGRGTTILDRTRFAQSFDSVTSLTEMYRNLGCEVDFTELELKRIVAEEALAEQFGADVGLDLFQLKRLIVVDKRPTAIITNYLLPSLVPSFDNVVGQMKSLYKFLEDFYDVQMDFADDIVTARMPTSLEREKLNLDQNTPVMVISRKASARGILFYHSVSVVDASDYQLSFHHTRRSRV